MLVLLLCGCGPSLSMRQMHGQAMGTTWQVTAWLAPTQQEEALRQAIESRLAQLVAEMSAWEPESALSRLNRLPGDACMALPEDLHQVLRLALQQAQRSGGAYDPSVAPLVDLWGFGAGGAARQQPPQPHEIEAARARVGWAQVKLDARNGELCRPAGWQLDINALGPGYAVDAMAQLLHAAGVEAFLVELGGEMRAAGYKPDGSDWLVGVEWPLADNELADQPPTRVRLRNAAIGSSGDYRVGFVHRGRRYSHTIDPRHGWPVDHALAAVSVIAERAAEADALAATLMVLGPDEGMDFARRHGLAAVFTLRHAQGYRRYGTPAFEAWQAQ